jgi:hypothetical protein
LLKDGGIRGRSSGSGPDGALVFIRKNDFMARSLAFERLRSNLGANPFKWMGEKTGTMKNGEKKLDSPKFKK